MSILDKWFLDEPVSVDGTQIDGWHFTMGVPYAGPLPLTCKMYQAGREIPVSFGGLDTPYFQKSIADAIVKIDPAAVEIFPVLVDGARNKYDIVNVTSVIDAIDKSSDIECHSEIDIINDPSKIGRYKYVRSIVLKTQAIAESQHIFRLAKFDNDIIVSNKLKLAIEKACPRHGGTFDPVLTI